MVSKDDQPAISNQKARKNAKPVKYEEADLEEFCLWLYSIYEETTLKST